MWGFKGDSAEEPHLKLTFLHVISRTGPLNIRVKSIEKIWFEKREFKMVGYKNICARLMRLISQIHLFLPVGLGLSVSDWVMEWFHWVSEWLSDWVIEWLSDWVIEWLSDWVIEDWVIEWLSDWVIEWLSDWVIEWLSDWVIEWLSGWVIEWVWGGACCRGGCLLSWEQFPKFGWQFPKFCRVIGWQFPKLSTEISDSFSDSFQIPFCWENARRSKTVKLSNCQPFFL
jgi:hypothetical protein